MKTDDDSINTDSNTVHMAYGSYTDRLIGLISDVILTRLKDL